MAAGLAAASAGAFNPTAPQGSEQIADRTDPGALYDTAVGPAAPLTAPPFLSLEGARQRWSFRAAPDPMAALRLLDGLRAQLLAAGYEVVFSCADTACGGFDFRRAQPVLPMPDMFVDLGSFSYFAARKDSTGGAEAPPMALASVIASQSSTAAYAQLTLVDDAPAGPGTGAAVPAGTAPAPTGALAARAAGSTDPQPSPAADDWTEADAAAAFAADGRIILDGTVFATGSTEIVGGPTPRVRAVAAWLKADPKRRVAVVGHSDWTGSVEANLKVSRARAAAVAAELTGSLGVPPAQVRIDGVGPLAPRAANSGPAGLQANRRVEVVALPDAG